jgi:spore coat protein A
MARHRRGRLLFCAATLALVAGGPLRADTAVLEPAKDNTLYEPIPPNNVVTSNGHGTTMFAGRTNSSSVIRRCLLDFDIAGTIPPGSTIHDVSLALYVDRVGNTGFYWFDLHRVTAEWGEGPSATTQGQGVPAANCDALPDAPPDCENDATWFDRYFLVSPWETPGGDFGPVRASQEIGPQFATYVWSDPLMVQDVQDWLLYPPGDHGWLLKARDEMPPDTAKRMITREATNPAFRPKLTVTYTPPSEPYGGCCEGTTCSLRTAAQCATIPGAVYSGDGTTCVPNSCVAAACCATDGTCSTELPQDCTAPSTFQGDGSSCGSVYCPLALTPFLDALPIPPTAVPVGGAAGGAATYDLTMKEFQQTLHSELPPTTVWGFDDGVHGPSFPGPTVEARSGEPVTVNWINDLRELSTGLLRLDHALEVDTSCIHGAEDMAKTVVHLHGAHVPAAFDGYPEATFLPGDPPETYYYPNGQQAAHLWYHDHALGLTRLNVTMGLAGLYYLRDALEDALDLPAGPYEIPLVIQDRRIDASGALSYPADWQEMVHGDKILVNGRVWPYLDVDRGQYRFRILNGSGSRTYTLSLVPPSGTLDFTVIGTEGGLLEAPISGVAELTIGPAERYDVIVDFSAFDAGDAILLENGAGAPFPGGPVDVTNVMQFRVGPSAGDTDPLPASLRDVEELPEASAAVTRYFTLRRQNNDACGGERWVINGLSWDEITEFPELGTTEIWQFYNNSGVSHPMHMHLVFFQILDRNGGQPPPWERGWKDTVMVGPQETVRVIARFTDYKGKYPYHCHILEHEDHEMMRQFQTVDCGDGVLDPTEDCDDAGLNGSAASCCTSSCRFAIGTPCADDGSCVTRSCLAGECTPAVLTEHSQSPLAVGVAESLGIGDFDGSGSLDLAVPLYYDTVVAIELGDGTGGFSPAGQFDVSTTPSPHAIAVADFDRDDAPDLAVTNADEHSVTVLLGDGAGGFAASPTSPLPVGSVPYSIVAGDFDGNDTPDLLTANLGSQDLSILLGDGAGGFQQAPASPLALGALPVGLAARDLDLDGDLDVAILDDGYLGSISILLGDGAGGFVPAPDSPIDVGWLTQAFAVGSFDPGGTPDLVVTRCTSCNGDLPVDNLAVLLGDGAGGFAPAPTSPLSTPDSPRIAVLDWSGDGRDDLVLGSSELWGLGVLEGDGIGGFSAPASLAVVAPFPTAIGVGDLDANGFADLATTSWEGQVWILLNALVANGAVCDAGPCVTGACDVGVCTAGAPTCVEGGSCPQELDGDGDGFMLCEADCDDAAGETHPGASEVNDGLDNQCPGDLGHGIADEISGLASFVRVDIHRRFTWPPQAGATQYEVARSTLVDFAADCRRVLTPETFVDDPENPLPGAVFHYLVRPVAPNVGSWGQRSDGTERVIVCKDEV